MDNKLLLAKCVTLLYRESLMPNRSENSADLVRTVLEGVKLPEVSIGINKEREILLALKATTLEMCENPLDHDYDKSDVMQRLRLNCHDDETLYTSLEQGIEPEIAEASIKRSVLNIRTALHAHFRDQKVDEILSKAANTFRFRRDSIKNPHTWISELVGQLEPFQIGAIKKDPAVISEIKISDESGTAQVFKEIKNQDTGVSLLKTGWQELNRMLQGGFRRGEEWMMGALQHNNKTGMSLAIFIQVALFNTPVMNDVTKKPLLLRISFEDDVTTNMNYVYKYLKARELRKELYAKGEPMPDDLDNIPIGDLTEEEIAAYVKEKLSVNGYEINFMRVDPSQWTYMHICNKIIQLEAEGYEIHLLMLDYLALVPTTGCTVGATGTDMRDLYRRIRNFTSPRKITCFTPHQLSTQAKDLIREGRQDFLGEVANKGYLAGCKQLDQEIDGEMYINIKSFKKKYYLEVQRGKHRGTAVLEDEYKYFALPFPKKGPILDDLEYSNVAVRKLGGDPIGSGGDERPFWDFGTNTF